MNFVFNKMRFQLPVACKYVAAALAAPDFRFYTLEEFVRVTDYPIDKFTVDNFCHNLIHDANIYISEQILDYCGYQGKLHEKKSSFVNTLKSNFEEKSDYWIYNNDSYNSHYKLSDQENTYSMFPNPNKFIGVQGKNQTNHIITTVECFRTFLKYLRTERVKDIRRFYRDLEKLIVVYSNYKLLYIVAENDIQIQLLNDKLIDLKVSNERLRLLKERLSEAAEEAAINRVLTDIDEYLRKKKVSYPRFLLS